MSFLSPMFLFLFLPIFISIYFILPKKFKNKFLLLGSLLFYIWGEPFYFPIILFMIGVNYGFGIALETKFAHSKSWLWFGIGVNILLLFGFKFLASYGAVFVDMISGRIGSNWTDDLKKAAYLPLGLSFLTFQVIAYLVDIFKKRTPASRNIFEFGLYTLLFPKIVSGPISTYRELIGQLRDRTSSLSDVANGFRRFSIGLAKKVLIADTLSASVNRVFALPVSDLTTVWAWLGIIGFTIQIYFDFSGYTDMAIGLGQVLGLKLPENFNYPYISRSITEFWRRWHLTLSNWFRDYVFYPLERKRKLTQKGSLVISVLIVFSLTGLWHGVTVNFLLWGLLQGICIIFEQTFAGKWLLRTIRPVQHIYALFLIILGWVLFRTSTLSQAGGYLLAMMGMAQGNGIISFYAMPLFENDFFVVILLGIVFSVPIIPLLDKQLVFIKSSLGLQIFWNLIVFAMLMISTAFIFATTYQPSLYARF